LKTGLSAVEADHCREVALKAGGLFEFTSRYLPANRYDEYLTLYAITALIRDIPVTVVDDSVKWAKLKWWMDELAAEPDSSSRHPILRALWASGARARLANGKLQRLVADALMAIDVGPNSDENGLFEHLAASGSTIIELELALDDASIDEQSVKYLGAASGLYDVLSGFITGKNPAFDQIPMNYLAKHNLGATQLQNNDHQAELALIIGELASTSLDWLSKGIVGLDKRAGQHLHLTIAMQRRRLEKISQNTNSYLESNKSYGPADAWFAWRFLRRLN